MAWAFKSTVPIYYQIVEEITARIFDGRYPPGAKIPTVRDIAEEAAVNPNTVQRAFSELENSGLIITMRTAGRVVTTDSAVIQSAKNAFTQRAAGEFLADMENRGITAGELLEIFGQLIKQNGKGDEHG